MVVGYFAETQKRDSLQTLWNNGFGNVSPQSFIQPTGGLPVVSNVLIANAPQLIVSIAYVSYNGLWTCMLLSREFTVFARKRRGLRVTDPQGKYQRSTYWLSLPYRFSVPLLGLSAAFHWVLSQTTFLIGARVYTPNGVLDPDGSNSISVVGWSALSLIVTTTLGGLLMVGPLLAGFVRYESNVPVVESCSLAISAACHTNGRLGEADTLLKYGTSSEDGGDYVGLSSGEVNGLTQGRRYTSRPCIKDLAAEALPLFPLDRVRKKRTYETLIFKPPIDSILFVDSGSSIHCSRIFAVVQKLDGEYNIRGPYIYFSFSSKSNCLFLTQELASHWLGYINRHLFTVSFHPLSLPYSWSTLSA